MIFVIHQALHDINSAAELNQDIDLMSFDEPVDATEIDFKNPEVAKAAVLLQASFRGLRARKQLKVKKVHVFSTYSLLSCHFACN